jgi:signal transduction histidine kinase
MTVTGARVANLVANSRHLLLAGFGGLLLLMIFAEYDGLRALADIQATNDSIREDYLLHTRVLDRIRADLYLSGTFVRDYLLETEGGKAEGHRLSLVESRRDMDAALGQYRSLLNPPETAAFEVLTNALGDYWKVLEPVLAWTTAERKSHGYPFLRDEVFPRRVAMLGIADQIGSINQSQLNSGKVRLADTFEQFRERLTTVIGLTIGLGLLLAAFATRRILSLEAETAQRFREISEARQELTQLSARLVDAQEDERRTISRELHDEVGQALTGTLLEMVNLSTLARAGKFEEIPGKAEEIKKEIEGSIGVVRNMALLLRPSMLDDLGLIPALQWQARELSRRSGLRIKVAAEGVPELLPEEHRTCIYRVVQEALHNAVRHAEATTVRVNVREEPPNIVLSIQDDGKGFSPHDERGLGLLGMKERVNRLDGTFTVDSAPGQGTVLRIVLPVPAGPERKRNNLI